MRLGEAEDRLIGLGRILVGGGAAYELHVRPFGFHARDEGVDTLVVIVLAGVFQHGIFALAIHRLGNGIGGIGALRVVVGGDVGDALGIGRVRREGHHGGALFDGAIDRLDERIGVHRMHQDAGRLLRQGLVESGDLLVDVIFRRAGIGGLAAELLAGLLEHLVDREPVFDARDHDVHDVFLTRFALERICGFAGKRLNRTQAGRCSRRDRERAQKFAQVSSPGRSHSQ